MGWSDEQKKRPKGKFSKKRKISRPRNWNSTYGPKKQRKRKRKKKHARREKRRNSAARIVGSKDWLTEPAAV